MYNDYLPYGMQEPFRHAGTAFCGDPGNMRQYGLACINLRAKHRKLKGWQKNLKTKK